MDAEQKGEKVVFSLPRYNGLYSNTLWPNTILNRPQYLQSEAKKRADLKDELLRELKEELWKDVYNKLREEIREELRKEIVEELQKMKKHEDGWDMIESEK